MARQAGDYFIIGTIDDLTYYKMDGIYFVRRKSSLTGKKFFRSKRFERSRKSSERFGAGNKLASKVYRMIEKEKRVYKIYCFLKRRAILLLKEGKGLVEAEEVLLDYLREFGVLERKMEELKEHTERKPSDMRQADSMERRNDDLLTRLHTFIKLWDRWGALQRTIRQDTG